MSNSKNTRKWKKDSGTFYRWTIDRQYIWQTDIWQIILCFDYYSSFSIIFDRSRTMFRLSNVPFAKCPSVKCPRAGKSLRKYQANSKKKLENTQIQIQLQLENCPKHSVVFWPFSSQLFNFTF